MHARSDPLLAAWLDPVPFLQLQRQVHLTEILEAKAAERLDFRFLLFLQHQLQLLHPLRVGANEVLLQLCVAKSEQCETRNFEKRCGGVM